MSKSAYKNKQAQIQAIITLSAVSSVALLFHYENDKAFFWPKAILLALLSAGLSYWNGQRALRPLHKIYQMIKARKLKKVPSNLDQTKIFDTELDDNDAWAEVELSIKETQQDLDKSLGLLSVENLKLATLLESISDSIIAINKNEQILFANTPFKANFIPKEIGHMNITELGPMDLMEDQIVKDCFKFTLEKGLPITKSNLKISINKEQNNQDKNQHQNEEEKQYFDLKVGPLKTQTGEMLGAVGVFHDVTERQLTEQMREDFVSNVSHEVRTPLTAMKGNVQMLKQSELGANPQWAPILLKIENNVDRLTNLFNDVLNLSVIESQASIVKENIDIKEATYGILSELETEFLEKNHQINVEMNCSTCYGQQLLLEQVLTNLIVNACKYTPSGGKITIRWFEAMRWGQTPFDELYTILEVEDTGPGIAPEHLPRLFERFYRVDPSRSKEVGGTGLGLAIVKHIMQKHDGQILVRSFLKQGSVFAACFPKPKAVNDKVR